MKRFKIVLSWLFVTAVMILIFILSSQVAQESDQLSGGFISSLYSLYLRITSLPCSTIEFDKTVESLQFIVRKSAHFCIYATLGLTFANAYYQSGIRKNIKVMVVSLLSSALYAATDEFHQLFVTGRSGEIRDIMIDSSGALTGIFVFILILSLRRKIWTLQKHSKTS